MWGELLDGGHRIGKGDVGLDDVMHRSVDESRRKRTGNHDAGRVVAHHGLLIEVLTRAGVLWAERSVVVIEVGCEAARRESHGHVRVESGHRSGGPALRPRR